ncbi:MAG TPA: HdeD family acid-resistance protein [Pantanalinema sp.]
MLATLTQNWWLLLVRGIFAILLGVAAMAWPIATAAALVILFGAYALTDGLVTTVGAFANRVGEHRWLMLSLGVISVIAGIAVFSMPLTATVAMFYVVAAWAVFRGVAQIVGAFQVKNEQTSQLLMGLGGLAWIVFGIMALMQPAVGFLAMMITIGTMAIIAGACEIALSFRVKGVGERLRVAMLEEPTAARAYETPRSRTPR